MVVFALILLFFANHQSPSILFDTVGAERPTERRATSPVFLVGMFMALFVVYGFDTAGTFGEETIDAEPPGAARRPVVDLALGHRRRRLPARRDPVVPGHRRRRWPRARRSASRSPTTIKDNLTSDDRRDHARRALPVRHPRVGLRLHPGDPGRDDPADVLDGPRPAPAARRACGATSTTPSRRRPTRPIAVGVLAALPILVTGPLGGFYLVDRGDRDDLPQLLPVQPRRPRSRAGAAGRTRRPGSTSAAGARSSTSSPWSGAALMIINIGLWTGPGPVRRLRRRPPRRLIEPVHQHVLHAVRRRRIDGPAGLADRSRSSSGVVLIVGDRLLRRRAVAVRPRRRVEADAVDRRGRHRLAPPSPTRLDAARRAIAAPLACPARLRAIGRT